MEEGIIECITGRKGNSTAAILVREVEYVNITVANIHSGFAGYTKSVQEVSYVIELAHESPAFDTVPAIQSMISSVKSSLIAASIVSTATEVAKDLSAAAFVSYATDFANKISAFDPIPTIEGMIATAKSSLIAVYISTATEVAKDLSAAVSLYATEVESPLIASVKSSLIAASIVSTAIEVAKESPAPIASYATELAKQLPAFDPIPAIQGTIASVKSSFERNESSAASFTSGAGVVAFSSVIILFAAIAFCRYKVSNLVHSINFVDEEKVVANKESSAALSLYYAAELQAIFISTKKNMFEVSLDQKYFTFNGALYLFTNSSFTTSF